MAAGALRLRGGGRVDRGEAREAEVGGEEGSDLNCPPSACPCDAPSSAHVLRLRGGGKARGASGGRGGGDAGGGASPAATAGEGSTRKRKKTDQADKEEDKEEKEEEDEAAVAAVGPAAGPAAEPAVAALGPGPSSVTAAIAPAEV